MRKTLLGTLLTLGAVVGAAGVANAQLNFTFLKSVDLSSTSSSANPQYIGNNPSALTWNGTTAWVGGYTSAAGNTGIVAVTDVLGTPAIGNAFGVLATTANRGLTALAINPTGTALAAAWDNGTASGDGVRQFATADNSLTWRVGGTPGANTATLRGDGIAYNPGVAGVGFGFASLNLGSGFLRTMNVLDGTYVSQPVINFTPASTSWRDVAFDPATGDAYTRESNRVGKALRTGAGTFGGSTVISPAGFATASAIDNQNLAFANASGANGGNFLIANNRSSSAAGQAFTTVVSALDTSGNALSINYDWTANGGSAPLNGNGAYDFSFHAGTQTLAMTDFANRQLYIFQLGGAAVPEPSALALGAFGLIGAGIAARRRRTAGGKTAR